MGKFREKVRKRFKSQRQTFRRRFRKGKEKLIINAKKLREFKLKYLNIHILVISLFFMLIFIGFELFLRTYNLYKDYSWVDVPSHFFAGMALAALAIWLFHFTKGRYKNSYVMISVFVASIMWEVLESLQELVAYNPPYLIDYFFWDGFWDIIVTLIGGWVFIKLFDWSIKIRLRRHVYDELSRNY